jgi:NAD(P)-dependent dehydrogenase (short-subunit alcohol dehydrogenase family)
LLHLQGYHEGRVLLTTSTSGLYGHFGQAKHAAKTAQVGLLQTLSIEG